MEYHQPPALPMRYHVRIHPLRKEDSCKATATVILSSCFVVRGIKVMDSAYGLFVSMPSYRSGNGK